AIGDLPVVAEVATRVAPFRHFDRNGERPLVELDVEKLLDSAKLVLGAEGELHTRSPMVFALAAAVLSCNRLFAIVMTMHSAGKSTGAVAIEVTWPIMAYQPNDRSARFSANSSEP